MDNQSIIIGFLYSLAITMVLVLLMFWMVYFKHHPAIAQLQADVEDGLVCSGVEGMTDTEFLQKSNSGPGIRFESNRSGFGMERMFARGNGNPNIWFSSQEARASRNKNIVRTHQTNENGELLYLMKFNNDTMNSFNDRITTDADAGKPWIMATESSEGGAPSAYAGGVSYRKGEDGKYYKCASGLVTSKDGRDCVSEYDGFGRRDGMSSKNRIEDAIRNVY
jgi:hypothetical protein